MTYKWLYPQFFCGKIDIFLIIITKKRCYAKGGLWVFISKTIGRLIFKLVIIYDGYGDLWQFISKNKGDANEKT